MKLLSWSIRSEEKMVEKPITAFQGELGAYSEQAIYLHFGDRVEAKPFESLLEVFEAAESGLADYAVVPVENSIEGGINETYDLLLMTDLKVSGEVKLRVEHCLIANQDAELGDIKLVYSHPQALAQCRNYLRRMHLKSIPTYDTAGSVKMVKEQGSRDLAAIASERAAKLYSMKILAKGIEDNQNNYTRFLVLSKEDSPPTGDDKTSIIFSLSHTPGSLYHALEEFATRSINLTKIESRPTREKAWEYIFYVDFEGHRTDRICQEAIEGLRKKAVLVKILGSYPRAR